MVISDSRFALLAPLLSGHLQKSRARLLVIKQGLVESGTLSSKRALRISHLDYWRFT
jgi:hypothetical protein